jgi:hypothetical protein
MTARPGYTDEQLAKKAAKITIEYDDGRIEFRADSVELDWATEDITGDNDPAQRVRLVEPVTITLSGIRSPAVAYTPITPKGTK